MCAEKEAPSPLSMMGSISLAIESERQASRGGSRQALRDLLSKVTAEYNRLCSIKRHRIDSARRALIYNLFLEL